jgi:hypothetical protein
MPDTSGNVENEQRYEALQDKGMSQERAASPRGSSSQGGTTAQTKAAGRESGKATARTS